MQFILPDGFVSRFHFKDLSPVRLGHRCFSEEQRIAIKRGYTICELQESQKNIKFVEHIKDPIYNMTAVLLILNSKAINQSKVNFKKYEDQTFYYKNDKIWKKATFTQLRKLYFSCQINPDTLLKQDPESDHNQPFEIFCAYHEGFEKALNFNPHNSDVNYPYISPILDEMSVQNAYSICEKIHWLYQNEDELWTEIDFKTLQSLWLYDQVNLETPICQIIKKVDVKKISQKDFNSGEWWIIDSSDKLTVINTEMLEQLSNKPHTSFAYLFSPQEKIGEITDPPLKKALQVNWQLNLPQVYQIIVTPSLNRHIKSDIQISPITNVVAKPFVKMTLLKQLQKDGYFEYVDYCSESLLPHSEEVMMATAELQCFDLHKGNIGLNSDLLPLEFTILNCCYQFSYKTDRDIKDKVSFKDFLNDYHIHHINEETLIQVTISPTLKTTLIPFEDLFNLLEQRDDQLPFRFDELYDNLINGLFSIYIDDKCIRTNINWNEFSSLYKTNKSELLEKKASVIISPLKCLSAKLKLSEMPILNRAVNPRTELLFFDLDFSMHEDNHLLSYSDEESYIPIRSALLGFAGRDKPLYQSTIQALVNSEERCKKMDHWIWRKDAPIRQYLPKDQRTLDLHLEKLLDDPRYSLIDWIPFCKATITQLQKTFAEAQMKLSRENKPLWDHLQQQLDSLGEKEKAKYKIFTPLNGIGTLSEAFRYRIAMELFPRLTLFQIHALHQRQLAQIEYLKNWMEIANLKIEATKDSCQLAHSKMKRFLHSKTTSLSSHELEILQNLFNPMEEQLITYSPDEIKDMLKGILDLIKKSCTPTYFNVLKVMYPLLADAYHLNFQLVKTAKSSYKKYEAALNIGDMKCSLETLIKIAKRKPLNPHVAPIRKFARTFEERLKKIKEKVP